MYYINLVFYKVDSKQYLPEYNKRFYYNNDDERANALKAACNYLIAVCGRNSFICANITEFTGVTI